MQDGTEIPEFKIEVRVLAPGSLGGTLPLEYVYSHRVDSEVASILGLEIKQLTLGIAKGLAAIFAQRLKMEAGHMAEHGHLRECPFCGGRMAAITSMNDGIHHTMYVECRRCQARGPVFSNGLGTYLADERETVTMWNFRPGPEI